MKLEDLKCILQRYTNTDLKDLESYSCDSPSSYCSTDNEPYACQNNYNFHITIKIEVVQEDTTFVSICNFVSVLIE